MVRRSNGPDWFPLAGAALAAWFVLSTASKRPPWDWRPRAATGPTSVPLVAGNSYLFIVRLSALEDAAREALSSRGAEMIEFAPASTPPFWAESDEPWSTSVVSFKATPRGNSTVQLGDDFYGIGRIERIIGL